MVNVTDTETAAVEVPVFTGGTAAAVVTEVYGVVSPEVTAAVPGCFVSEAAVVSAGIEVTQDVVYIGSLTLLYVSCLSGASDCHITKAERAAAAELAEITAILRIRAILRLFRSWLFRKTLAAISS